MAMQAVHAPWGPAPSFLSHELGQELTQVDGMAASYIGAKWKSPQSCGGATPGHLGDASKNKIATTIIPICHLTNRPTKKLTRLNDFSWANRLENGSLGEVIFH